MANKESPDFFGRQAEEVRSIFGDLEIVEARVDHVVYVTALEHEHGKRGDPNKCMFSEACKRALGSKAVLFYPTVAYIDIIDPKDPTRSYRRCGFGCQQRRARRSKTSSPHRRLHRTVFHPQSGGQASDSRGKAKSSRNSRRMRRLGESERALVKSRGGQEGPSDPSQQGAHGYPLRVRPGSHQRGRLIPSSCGTRRHILSGGRQ